MKAPAKRLPGNDNSFQLLQGSNYVSALQEWAIQKKLAPPSYGIERTGGSDHAPDFTCTVTLTVDRAKLKGTGQASNKKEAKRLAAQQLTSIIADRK